MSTTLIRNAALLATMDDDQIEIPNGSLLIEGNRITALGPGTAVPTMPTRSSTPRAWS